MSSSVHYALVHPASGSQSLSVPRPTTNTSDDDAHNSRTELSQLYQHYAELYPNPRLLDEYKLRNTLLQATSAAVHARSTNRKPRGGGGVGGFLARLFGGGENNEDNASNNNDNNNNNNNKGTDTTTAAADAPLIFTTRPNPHDDGSLCGTRASLDPSCIPLEAIAVARFHLTSRSTRGSTSSSNSAAVTNNSYPNAVRWGPLLGRATPSSIIVIGLGVVAEFQPHSKEGGGGGAGPTIRATSDRAALQDYEQSCPETFQLDYVRACAISPNCIVVSWGFQDGLLGVYRRSHFPPENDNANNTKKKKKKPKVECGWEQLWMIGPSPAVLDSIGDVFSDDVSHPGSPLLRVTDLIPLRVTTGDNRQPMVATVALSRLGGYLELVPIPTELWFGAPLTPETYRRPKPPKRPKPGQHYALGKPMGAPTVALTTGEHHLDVQSIEALRTTVGLETEWNNRTFPKAPPSEYILAAAGMSTKSPGHECISFWSVCTLFTDDDKNQGGDGGGVQNAAPFGFQLHASLLDAQTVLSGAQVSIFATPEILQYWRMPRHVELRPDAAISNKNDVHDNDDNDNAEGPFQSNDEDWKKCITTISTPAPIVSMQFLDQRGTAILAVVDWNGGMSIYDCAPMERMASQQLQPDEFEQYQQKLLSAPSREEGDLLSMPASPLVLAHSLVSRTQVASIIGRQSKVGAIHWLKPNAANDFGGNPGSLTPLVLLLRNSSKLLVVTFAFEDDYGRPTDEPQGSVLAIPFPGQGATMGDLGSGNLLFVSLRSDTKQTGFVKLSCCVMQQLQPTAIVESLAREGKYKEAIAAANNLDELDQATLAEVLEDCHKRIWEKQRDSDSLAETRNVAYIVEQTLAICESTDHVDDGLSLESLRVLCKLATTMARNNRTLQESLNRIGAFMIRFGTYELLCKYYSATMTVQKFRTEFQSTSMFKVAKSIAERGDMTALSIVLFRHRSELLCHVFDILAFIPLSIHPENIVHLLPVTKNGRVTDMFLRTTATEDFPVHLSQMPLHIKEIDSVAIVMDVADEKLVLEHNTVGIVVDAKELQRMGARWFLKRSSKMQSFTGNMDLVIVFCETGLRCNGYDRDLSIDPEGVLQPLYKTWRSAASLQSILMDDFVAFQTNNESNIANTLIVSTDDLLSMELPELVDLILQGESDGARIRSRCTDFLQPLLLDLNSDSHGSDGQALDSALASYCSGLACNCISMARSQESTPQSVIESAAKTLATCAAIAISSSSSTPKHQRLIQNTQVLIQSSLQIIRDISFALENAEIYAPDGKNLVVAMWEIYESLPDRLPSSMEASQSYEQLIQDLDDLYADLLCVDILSGWPGTQPFSFLAKRQRVSNQFSSEVAYEVIVKLCKSFAANVLRLKTKDKKSMLLKDLLSDMVQIQKHFGYDLLDIPSILCTRLVRPLLQLEHFNFVVEYCNSEPSLVETEQVKRAVLDYVDEAVFSESDSGNQIMAAMKCQDIIGPAFPQIQPGFLTIRRYLDAAHFISTVIYEGRVPRPIRPADLRRQLPLDAIETILRDVPESIICGCPQWQDEMHALSFNDTLRAVERNRNPEFEAPLEMPVLPGGAVFHLATILGLEDEKSALVVKARVIHHAVSVGLYGAAAAICRTMVSTKSDEILKAAALAKLEAVAQIVTDDKYTDLATRQELCQTALTSLGGHLEVATSTAFDAICSVSSLLDHRNSRHSREKQAFSDQRLKHLLARPVSRLQQHILAEYNADVHELFADLIRQTSNGMIHDSLMNALGRFVIYWCVSDSKTLRHRLVMSEKSDARENLALGCSLILQIPSKLTAGNCVHELQKVAADEASNVSSEERFSSDDDICIPDPQLVGRMIGRGYMENAARRAVVMTRNAGYTEALGWAVTHTLDPDFNDPIVIVRDPRRAYIDEDAIQLLQKSLFATERWLDGDSSLEALQAFLSMLHGPASGVAQHSELKTNHKLPVVDTTSGKAEQMNETTEIVTPVNRSNYAPPKALKVVAKVPVDEQRALPAARTSGSIPGLPAAQQTVRTNANPSPANTTGTHKLKISPKGVTNGSTQVTAPRPTSKPASSRPPVPPTPPPTPPPRNGSQPKEQTPASIVGTSTGASTRSTTPLSRDTAVRSELFRRGQEARSKLRSNGGANDRKKLIAGGRELLRRARSGKGYGVAPIPSPSPSTPAALAPALASITSTNGIYEGPTATNAAKDDASEASGWDFDNFDDL